MPVNRFQPPVVQGDPKQSFDELGRVLDTVAPLPPFRVETAASVSIAAGDFRRLAPRATGMDILIPTADGSNCGLRIVLIIESALGVARVRAASGTINGSTAFTLAAGYTTVIELFSNGAGKWATTRAAGYPTAGNALQYTGDTLDYVGSTDNINITPTTGALGIIDISTLHAGGTVSAQNVTNASIDGFSTKPAGFWFIFNNRDTSSGTVKLTSMLGGVSTDIRTPGTRDLQLYKNDSVLMHRGNNRWNAVLTLPQPWLPRFSSLTWAAQQNDFAIAQGTNHLRITLTGNQTLTGIVAEQSTNSTPDGTLLVIDNIDTVDFLRVAHLSGSSAAANQFTLPEGLDIVISPGESAMFVYDNTSTKWRHVGPNPHGRLLKRTFLTTGTAATFTHDARCASFIVRGVGGGGAAGGTSAVAGAAGAGGASGTEGEKRFALVSTALTSTYTVGAGGVGVSNSTGGTGGDSTWTYNGTTSTLTGGLGGAVLAGAATVAFAQGGSNGAGGTNVDRSNPGQPGGFAYRTAAATTPCFGGRGGSCPYGAGGWEGATASTVLLAAAAQGAGSGGGGAAKGTSTTAAAAGSNGTAGLWIVEEYS